MLSNVSFTQDNLYLVCNKLLAVDICTYLICPRNQIWRLQDQLLCYIIIIMIVSDMIVTAMHTESELILNYLPIILFAEAYKQDAKQRELAKMSKKS